ncbi:CBL-interacting serine/threonine-protein kinase 20 [Fusarium oxysporum f. sp. rapae]|uniref:CBL-interacting serine/threonine-protein kinase 20 n=1 Tax=Fusarium oxysporum f. sp. rapae TaxID=485398 RepID=A0A8J5TQ65_FUSOX|nr:CBL-interacting serine/threonine-protein kinase 20 [Fusarium oxysporum f. sp. rapae]
MNLWMRLPKHPHIVAFDKNIVDKLEARCVGFTTEYAPGGTLEENKCRTFKLKWPTELVTVIDELNLNLGIAHQNIAPRNLLIDEEADSMMIFDFNFSGVIFTIYEIITRDETLRAVRHEEQNVLEIEQKDWVQHPDVQLDHPVSEFRKALREWSEKRRRGKQITAYKDAPNFIDWPDTPQPPTSERVVYYDGKPTTELKVLWSTERKRLLEQGKTVLNWQRLPQCKLKPGDRILETGEFITRA